MMLLNPLLGLFAALGAVPVIIHLLNRTRFKVVVWAAMEFLLATIRKNSRRLQIRDIILMLLRASAIALVALAMARPTIAPGRFGWLAREGETAAVIILDNSLSMARMSGRESRFDAAKRMALAVLEQLPKGSSAAFVLMSDVAVEEIPELTHDLAFVASEVQRAPLSDGGTNVLEGLEAAWRIVSKAPAAAREIYLATDLQKNSWPDPSESRWVKLFESLCSARPRVKLIILDAGDGATENVSIEALSVTDELVSSNSSIGFDITLRNHGSAPVEDVAVELYIGQLPIEPLKKVAGAVLDRLETVATVRLESHIEMGGCCRVEARISPDRLASDDARRMVLDVLPPVRVLVVDGEPAESEDLLSGETGFLQLALAPLDPENPDERGPFEIDSTTVYGLGGKNLRDYDAVVLANVAEVPLGLADSLKSFVRSEGKGLVIFLGDNVNPRSYNEFLSAGLLPGRLLDSPVLDTESGWGLATEGLDHPIVSFFAPAERRPFLAAPRFVGMLPVELEPSEDVHVVARFTNGRPAIAERRFARGSVVLFTSSADREWTDFPLRPAYLPVVRRMLQHVSIGRRAKRTVSVHERMVEVLGPRESGTRCTVRDPRGTTRQLTAELAPSGEFAVLELAETPFAGFYEFARSGGISYFAANPPRQESSLDAFSEAELRARYPGLEFRWIARSGDPARALAEERVGREVWPVVLLLVFMCLGVESVLALVWAPSEK